MVDTNRKVTSSMATNGVNSKRLEELVGSLSRAYDESIAQALERHECNFVVTDPRFLTTPSCMPAMASCACRVTSAGRFWGAVAGTSIALLCSCFPSRFVHYIRL